jgi:hypothetical protein
LTEAEPIHVTFARVCMGWTECHEIDDLFNRGRVWIGVHPNSITEAPDRLPRVDLPGYDLLPWVQVNRVSIHPTEDVDWWEAQPPCDGEFCEHDSAVVGTFRHHYVFGTAREAVLRCLVALGEAGKLVRP